MEDKNKIINYFINLCFILYFVILLVERILSVVLSLVNGINMFSNGFNAYTYSLVFVSIVGWLIYFIARCRLSIKGLFNKEVVYPFFDLCLASGILLLSGMVHTEYTIPVVQFISYGILIIGILLKVILLNNSSQNRTILWLSFSYLVAFSMAIPVMYRSMMETHVLFHILEAIISFGLVIAFTVLFAQLFNGKENLFYPLPIIVALFGDTALIILRWKEEINYFVLIFISLSVVLFVVGYIISLKKKKD